MIPTELDFYLIVNGQPTFLKRDSFRNIPRPGDSVTLYVNEQNISYRVVDVEHFNGTKRSQILIEAKH